MVMGYLISVVKAYNPHRNMACVGAAENSVVDTGEDCDNVSGCTNCIADYGYTCKYCFLATSQLNFNRHW